MDGHRAPYTAVRGLHNKPRVYTDQVVVAHIKYKPIRLQHTTVGRQDVI